MRVGVPRRWRLFTAAALGLTAAFIVFGAGLGQTRAADPQRLEIVVEKGTATGWEEVDPGLIFEKNDKVRFRVTPNFSGYLYVMNRGTSGEHSLLFPSEDTGDENRIQAEQQYVIPATKGWFRISGPPGHEIVYWLVSPLELGRKTAPEPPYKPLPPPPPVNKVPSNLLPRCDETILRARGDCVDSSAGARAVEDEESLPENLAGIPNVRSRQLLFLKDEKKSVVGSESVEGPVIFEFRLAHR